MAQFWLHNVALGGDTGFADHLLKSLSILLLNENMDWMTFTVELAKAIAWPAAFFFGLLLIRQPLFDLLPFLKKLKYREFTIEFSEKVREVSKATQEAVGTEVQDLKQIGSAKERYAQLIEVSPRAAISEVWSELELAMIESIRRHELAEESQNLRGHSRLGHVLLDAGVINRRQFELFHELAGLRHRAVHADEFEMKREDATSYVESALLFAAHLRSS